MEAIPASTLSKTLYQSFCETEEDLPIFVKYWYLDTVCEGGEWQVVLVKKKGKIVASFPFFKKKKLGFDYISMPHFLKWMGIYITPNHRSSKLEQEILHTILPHFPKVDAFKQNFHPDLLNWSPLYWQDFKQTTLYTYRIDLEPALEDIQKSINRNIRRNINKAKKTVTIEHDLEAEHFYRINKMSFDRQKVAIPYELPLFLKHHHILQKKQSSKIIFAVDTSGIVHAAAYLIWDKQCCYYHLAGENPEFRSSGAGILLVWKAIEYAKEVLKVNTFDFEGSMLPNVAHIRKQFGAYAVPYSFIWKYENPLYQILDFLQQRI